MEHTDAQKEDRETTGLLTTDLLTTLLVTIVLFDKWFFEYFFYFRYFETSCPKDQLSFCQKEGGRRTLLKNLLKLSDTLKQNL